MQFEGLVLCSAEVWSSNPIESAFSFFAMASQASLPAWLVWLMVSSQFSLTSKLSSVSSQHV
jgi:hypothetical protein